MNVYKIKKFIFRSPTFAWVADGTATALKTSTPVKTGENSNKLSQSPVATLNRTFVPFL